MLRYEEIQERKWGSYPALRRIVKGKKLPVKYYGETSISDSIFTQIDRFIEITLLVKENETEIINHSNKEDLIKDITKLKQGLSEINEFVCEQMAVLKQICNQLEK